MAAKADKARSAELAADLREWASILDSDEWGETDADELLLSKVGALRC